MNSGFKTTTEAFTTTNSPFAGNKPEDKNTIFSGISGMFSGGGQKDTLPFTYSDPFHTKTSTESSSSNNNSNWLPTFLTSASTSTNSPSLATSTPKNEWLEYFGLTRTQRYTAFGFCMIAAIFLFLLALFHLPFVVIRPGKFVVPYCMASLFILISFGFIHGFVSYTRHLISPKKLPYSAWFFLSTFATLYSALSLKSYLLTVVSSLVQMAGMVVFIVSYVPGGSSGISFMSSFIGSSIKSRFSPNSF